MDLKEIGWSGMDWIDLAQDWDHLRALVCRILMGKPKGKRTLGRPRRR
jgi:hypothetical protein